MISNTTHAGLTRLMSKESGCYLCSSEIYELFNKFLRSDADNATGVSQLLCKLFTGTAYLISQCIASKKGSANDIWKLREDLISGGPLQARVLVILSRFYI